MAKNTTKASATPDDAKTTEAKNADTTEQLPKAPVADQAANEPPTDGASESQTQAPESVTLSAPYGYIDEHEMHQFWHSGTVVTDADQIADLMARKAPLEGINHGNKE